MEVSAGAWYKAVGERSGIQVRHSQTHSAFVAGCPRAQALSVETFQNLLMHQTEPFILPESPSLSQVPPALVSQLLVAGRSWSTRANARAARSRLRKMVFLYTSWGGDFFFRKTENLHDTFGEYPLRVPILVMLMSPLQYFQRLLCRPHHTRGIRIWIERRCRSRFLLSASETDERDVSIDVQRDDTSKRRTCFFFLRTRACAQA